MGDCVQPGRHGQTWRQRQRQFDIIEYDFGQHAQAALHDLLAAIGFTKDRRGFAAGVGRGHRDMWQVCPQRDCLAEADG